MRPSHLSCTTATFGGKLPEKLRAMQSAGFAATEFWPRDLFENAEGPDVAIDLLRQSGLAVSAYQALRNFEGLSQQMRGRKLGIAEQLMDQMALVGCDLLVLCSNTDPDSDGDHERIADDLRLLGDLARSRNVRIAYEALSWGQWIRDYRDAWQLIKAADHENIGMMLDSFHIFALDLPLDGIDAISAEKVFLVEIADLPGTTLEPIEISRHYRLFPGEGVGPIDEFLRRVRAIGYTGCFGVEMHGTNKAAPAIPAFLITDALGLKRYGLGLVQPGGKGLERFLADGYLMRANSLSALARRLGIDPAVLDTTIARFNDSAVTGVDEDFGRGSTPYQRLQGDATLGGPNPTLGPIVKAPFYAVRLYPSDTSAATGLLIDEHASVVDANTASPSPGSTPAAMTCIRSPPALILARASRWGQRSPLAMSRRGMRCSVRRCSHAAHHIPRKEPSELRQCERPTVVERTRPSLACCSGVRMFERCDDTGENPWSSS